MPNQSQSPNPPHPYHLKHYSDPHGPPRLVTRREILELIGAGVPIIGIPLTRYTPRSFLSRLSSEFHRTHDETHYESYYSNNALYLTPPDFDFIMKGRAPFKPSSN